MNDFITKFQQDFLSFDFLMGHVGAPFIIGMAVGYFAKKMIRIALFLGGAAIVLLFVTEYYGVVSLNDNQLQHATDAVTNVAISSGNFLVQRLASITSRGVSGAAGFFAGFKLG